MARAKTSRSVSPVERFIQSELTEDDEDRFPPTVIISVRVEPQTVGDLEDLAGRLDMTRTMLARRLIEAGLEEAEEAYARFTQQG